MSTINYAYKAAFFTVTAKSNLHAGAGGENFWIVDNLIQRDTATNLPCIYSSSLKGALREYMRDYLKSSAPEDWLKILFEIFGYDKSDINEDLDNEKMQKIAEELGINNWKKMQIPGSFRFFQAELLSIPVLKDNFIIHKVTSPWLVDNLTSKLDLFNLKMASLSINDIMGSDEQIDDNLLCECVDDYNLPVIARNHLEDGTSTNLWYEQVLPRETKLFFSVLYANESLFDTFKKAITSNPIQIGANASIGYGFCKVDYIETKFKQ